MQNSTCLLSGVGPLELLIRNSQVIAADPDSAVRGIAAVIGQQFFSMIPDINRNDTLVSSVKHCDSTSLGCIAESGGVYTYKPEEGAMTYNGPAQWNGTNGEDIDGTSTSSYALFNDVATLGNATIYGLPFATVDNSSDKDQASLALGMKSSFLDTALQSHAVPSKQFSYWPGRDSYSEYNSIDGLLVIGGYDENRLASGTEIHEYKLTSNGEDEYRMFVEIKGLDWQYSANNSTSLLPEDSDTDTWFGVLDTSYKYVDLPFSSHEKFAVANNGTYNTTRGLYTYNNLQSYDGELVVTFVDGFQVKISADDLFEYPMEYEKTTGELDYAEYPPQLVDNIWQDYGTFSSPLGLGLPFLMSVLLVTDYDQDSFYLANANTDDRPRNVLPLCTGGPTSLDPMANATLGNNTSANGNNNSDGIHKSDTNVAAIAGGVGGGVGAVLILATLAFFFIRRRKQQQSAQHIPFLPEVSEQPHRGSTMSSPLKYMDANIYETNNSDHEERYRSPQSRSLDFVIPQLDRDRGNNSPWSTTVPANSTTDAGTDNQESGMGTHEMSSGNRFSATSGPVEMPSDFDYRP